MSALSLLDRDLPFLLDHELVDAEQRYLVQTTRADMEWLRDRWIHDLSDDEIRRASSVLRRLLVDRTYGIAWRAARLQAEPRIEATSLDRLLTIRGGTSGIVFGQAGGDTGTDLTVALVLQHVGPRQVSPTDMDDLNENFGLSGYLMSTSMVIDEQPITRQQVVKYVANRLGGAHIGLEGTPAKDRQAFDALDRISWRITSGRQSIYLEMLAIGFTVARSADLQRFVEAARAADL